MKNKYHICPTCKQDMRASPHQGLSGKDCTQCGQGLRWQHALALRNKKHKPARRIQKEKDK